MPRSDTLSFSCVIVLQMEMVSQKRIDSLRSTICHPILSVCSLRSGTLACGGRPSQDAKGQRRLGGSGDVAMINMGLVRHTICPLIVGHLITSFHSEDFSCREAK